jgi:Concanavalin A-like lectin/glucanases superfamily
MNERRCSLLTKRSKQTKYRQQTMKETTTIKNLTMLAVIGLGLFGALPTRADGIIPYTNDAYTVLLDHFDGSTSANILAYTNTGAPCGNALPLVTPSYSYGSGAPGLNQALTLYPPASDLTARSYLKYPGGELLSLLNGTMECWINLSNYDFNFHQYNFWGECQGDVGGISIQPTGQLTVSMWYTTSTPVYCDSGTNLVPLNTWTHVALSWGSAGLRLYINGALVGTNSNTGFFADWFGKDSLFVSGKGIQIDELRISRIQRTNFNVPYPTASIRVSQVEVCWNSVSNLLYQVQYRSDLTTNQWANFGPPVAGTGYDCVTDAVSAETRFYRVILLP